MNTSTLNTIQGTIQEIKYLVEPVVNDLDTPSMLEKTIFGITDFFDRTTQSSFEAWEKTDQTRYL